MDVWLGVLEGVFDGVEEGMKYVALGVGVGPSVEVCDGVGDSKTAVGFGRVAVMNSGVIVAIICTVGVAVVRLFTVFPTHTMINPNT